MSQKLTLYPMKILYYVPAKYRQFKLICQTLRQNDVQLNKSVTVLRQTLMIWLSIGLMLAVVGGCGQTATEPSTGAVASQDTLGQLETSSDDKAPVPTIVVSPTALPTLSPTPAVNAAIAVTATATAHPMRQPPQQLAATLIKSQSPLPTPLAQPTAQTELLPVALPTVDASLSLSSSLSSISATAEIQAQMTVSMALAAQTLLHILQQPMTSDSALVTPTATVESFIALTNVLTDTVAPPLPTDQIGLTLPPTPVGEPEDVPPLANLSGNPPLQPDGASRSVQVPILMYHYLSIPPDNADIYRRDLSVSPALFAAHLDRMLAEGYSVIPLYDLIAHLTQGTPLPPKPVVITFDDGYRDNYEYAFPLLRERNLPATFFIVMEFINQERPEYLTWEMVREMAAGGMDFEVHGVDHTTLRGRSRTDLEFQALRSYETIRNLLNYQPRFVSYPAGEYDQQTIEVFQSAGYWAGFTTVQGATHSSDRLFELERVRVRGTTTADELGNLLALDW